MNENEKMKRTIDNERRKNHRRQDDEERKERERGGDEDELCFYFFYVAQRKIDRILCIDIYMDLKYFSLFVVF